MSVHDSKEFGLCDKLAAYEMSLLTPSERLHFETHLDACEACLNELYAMAPAAVAMTTEPSRYLQAARSAAGAGQQRDDRRGWYGRFGAWRALAPIALAAALALVVFWPGTDDDAWRALTVLEPLPYSQIAVRGQGSDDITTSYTNGMTAYQAADYHAAAVELARAATGIAADPAGAAAQQPGLPEQVQLYLAVSLLLDDQPREALAHLEIAHASRFQPIKENALWYRAQAHLLLGEPQASLDALAPLSDSPVYSTRSRELAEQIRTQGP